MSDELDDIDRRLLFELDLNCRLPDTSLARLVGKSKESVRYRVRKMKESGIIAGFTSYIDGTRLGLRAHKLYLRTRERPAPLRAFIADMRARPDVFWLATGDGAWKMGLTFFAQNNLAFFNAKNDIFSRFRELVLEERVATVVEAQVLGKKFLAPKRALPHPYRLMGHTEQQRIDAADLAILTCLIAEGRMSYVDIALHANISPDSVRHRLKAMERGGIVPAHALAIDHKKLGYEFYKSFLFFEGLTVQQEKRLFELARKHPHIVNYLKVIAPWDIELEIMARNYAHYNDIVQYLCEQFPDSLVKVETTVEDIDEVFPARQVPRLSEP